MLTLAELQDMYPFTLETLAGSPTLAMGISFFFWIPLCVAFGRRPVLIISSLMLAIATLGAGFAAGFYQLLVAICFIGFAVGATLSTVSLDPLARTKKKTKREQTKKELSHSQTNNITRPSFN